MMNTQHLGYAIQIIRRQPGKRINQIELANACKVGESTVSKWETGRVPVPDEHLETICRVLGVTRKDLKRVARQAA